MAGTDAWWTEALRGDFGPLTQRLASRSEEERVAAEALLALVGRRPPVEPDRASPSARALRAVALGAAIRGDIEALARVEVRQRGGDRGLTARWLRLWTGAGDPPPLDPSDPVPGNRVEGAALEALVHLLDGRVQEGLADARRAARMARSEGLVLHELLTSLVLARCRRLEGRPHMTLRILASVAQVAPEPWRGWLRYEQRLAGDPKGEPGSTFAPLQRLQAIVDAAPSGGDSKSQVASAPEWVKRELAVLAESIDADCDLGIAPRGWLDGSDPHCPSELVGLCIPDVDADGEHPRVGLRLGPGRLARRVLLLEEKAKELSAYDLSRGRTLTAIAHLACAPALGRPKLFERVYGFEYIPARHAGTLRVLLHRLRAALPHGLTLDDDDRLEVDAEVLLPDPRVAFDHDALVLRHLARNAGRSSARETAEALGLSARTVQNVLSGLVGDGTCTSVREGRRVEYRLEDTTLSEPTLSRLQPRGLAEL